ncbi:hypothetical protein AVEN_83516-1 [Araneus ventricosus]|uniref:Uncharacterized protein n=1 Tax=Araneus ventricosus TaxID=182803 RepID=A0A4Y2TV58_ARAVE|nr:hypothetical protein AVEN_83516-1 [Araneus ventricosus]
MQGNQAVRPNSIFHWVSPRHLMFRIVVLQERTKTDDLKSFKLNLDRHRTQDVQRGLPRCKFPKLCSSSKEGRVKIRLGPDAISSHAIT